MCFENECRNPCNFSCSCQLSNFGTGWLIQTAILYAMWWKQIFPLGILVLLIVGLDRWRMLLVICRMELYAKVTFLHFRKLNISNLRIDLLEIQASGSLERGTWSRPLFLFKKVCGLLKLVYTAGVRTWVHVFAICVKTEIFKMRNTLFFHVWAPNVYGTSSTIYLIIFLKVLSKAT